LLFKKYNSHTPTRLLAVNTDAKTLGNPFSIDAINVLTTPPEANRSTLMVDVATPARSECLLNA